jgi:hypothetical protein
LWRTILSDTSLDGQHPAPKGLAENFRIFVTVFAGIYILKAGLHGRDETAARDAIASALNELKCGSELPNLTHSNQQGVWFLALRTTLCTCSR